MQETGTLYIVDLVRALVLGLLQGLTEFLPVSSDGHLLLVRRLFAWPDEGLAFDAMLHLGTFLAVLVVFRATWWRLFLALLGRGTPDDRRLVGLLILATVPAALAGFVTQSFLAGPARTLGVAGVGFLSSAFLLFLADRRAAQRHTSTAVSLTRRQALTVGLFQVLALLPGLSRSGATIAGGMLHGLSRPRAVEFSFLLSLPIVGAAGLSGLLDMVEDTDISPLFLVATLTVTFLTGLAAIHALLHYIRRHTFTPFVLYLLVLAVLSLLFSR